MNSKKLSILLATSLLLACGADNQDLSSDELVPLSLSSGISVGVITRAFDSSWEKNDKIGVFTTEKGTTNVTMSGSVPDGNVPYKVGVSETTETYANSTPTPSTFSADPTPIYLPANGDTVDVYAYCPYTEGVTAAGGKTITVDTVQETGDHKPNQKSFDVLTAKTTSTKEVPIWRNRPQAQLTFNHCMSKVLIKVRAGTGYSDSDISGYISSVEMNGQPTSATFYPISQTISVDEARATITPYEVKNGEPDYDETVLYTYRAIILPNNVDGVVTGNEAAATGRSIVFSIGSVTYSYNPTHVIDANNSEPYVFLPGQQTTFTITLSGTGITVSSTIQPWTVTSESKTLYPKPTT